MRRHTFLSVFVCLVSAGLAVSAAAQTAATHVHYAEPDTSDPELGPTTREGHLAPRLQNLGDYQFPITTKSERAQKFFNQGLNLGYGFNHREAARAFAEAARLDPDAAMAYWGHAWVLGPNINAPMDPADEPLAFELVQKALALRDKVGERERAYLEALAPRYSGKAEDRRANDRAFAEAMRELHEKFPGDLDAATIFAEALMDLRPWNYWTRDGVPYPGTEEVIAALDGVIRREPDHPGALHYWIHLWEPTKTPERAEEAADRLVSLAPGAGHLVHMPGHIYQRVGRYIDVVDANQLAIEADEDYITQCRAQGIYPLGYYPHNIHFKWFGATMAGQSRVALEAARKTAASIPHDALQQMPFLQGFLVVPYYAMVRFGKWDEILQAPPPHYDSLFTRGAWHYARGSAFMAKGKLPEAQKELDLLKKIVADPKLPSLPASFSVNTAADILRIAPEVLAGELAARKGDFEKAISHLEKAVRLQDAFVYTEPDDWHYPVRHSLGAVLLAAGRPLEAEVVYWDDLQRNPENGWALYGLWQALQAQGKDELAAGVEERFREAWAGADIELTASRF